MEEAIAVGEAEVVELPISESVFRLLIISAAIFAFIAAGRSVYLAVVKNAWYSERAAANANETRIAEAKRGLIFDRFGQLLVENVPTFGVRLKVAQFLKASPPEQEEVLRGLTEVSVVTAEQFWDILRGINLESTSEVLLARNLNPGQIVRMRSLDQDIVSVGEDYFRKYKEGDVFSSVIGYTGSVSRDELAANPNLFLNDAIGKAGLELRYDGLLRGENGISITYRNAKGDLLENQTLHEAKVGSNLTLTIDAEFQRYFYQRMRAGLASLGRTSGVGLAVDPRNGEILSLISLPSYDNNAFSETEKREERSRILTSRDKPLFNRVISGMYNPGSTIKPLVATAALTEGIVTPETKVFSAGYIEIPNPYFPDQPSRFLDWKPHGWVDVHSALARSSNVYFYSVGGGFEAIKGLGIAKLEEWWKKFGFGTKTGVDFTGEAEGFLPDPEKKESRTGDIWRLGDTYNVSIGQGDFLVTPLQLLNYISAIANGGTLWRPHIAKNDDPPQILNRLEGLDNAFAEVRKGMKDAVAQPYGTAYSMHDLPFSIAAKSGTAQIQNNAKNNALLVAYTPAQEPQIAVLVLVEDAPESVLSATPIAKDVLRWYYENRIK